MGPTHLGTHTVSGTVGGTLGGTVNGGTVNRNAAVRAAAGSHRGQPSDHAGTGIIPARCQL